MVVLEARANLAWAAAAAAAAVRVQVLLVDL
jgi:hypothetical protein